MCADKGLAAGAGLARVSHLPPRQTFWQLPGQVFKLSRGGLPYIISLMQIYLHLLIQ